MWTRKNYKLFYDRVHSHYYNLLMRWCFLPFGGEASFRQEMIRHVDFSPGDKILDMCCGTGGATRAIATRVGTGSEVIGMDLSSGQVAIARKHNRAQNIRFLEGDVTSTGLGDAHFDKVFITHALHEMTHEIRLQVLLEARRVLREGGRLIVLDLDDPGRLPVRLFIAFWFFYWLPFNFETPTRRDMLERGLSKEVEQAGFRRVVKRSMFHAVFQVVQGVK